jgi:hypothetical protein
LLLPTNHLHCNSLSAQKALNRQKYYVFKYSTAFQAHHQRNGSLLAVPAVPRSVSLILGPALTEFHNGEDDDSFDVGFSGACG